MLEDSSGIVRYRVNCQNGLVQAETRGGVRPSFWRRVSPQTAERVRVSLADARQAARKDHKSHTSSH